MSRKTMERQARQQFIVDAARRLFAAQGVEETSMDDIAAAVEYSRRTLYAYFRSRDEVCLSVLLEDLENRWSRQQQAMLSAETGLDKILAWGKSFHEFVRENPHSVRLQSYMDFRGIVRDRTSEEVFAAFASLNTQLAEGLRDIFRLGVEDGSLRPELDIDLCISQYLYTLRSVFHRAFSTAYSFTSFDPDEYIEHYLDLFRRSIRNEGGSRQ